jgi:catalase
VSNIIAHLGQATDERIKTQQVRIFAHVNEEFGKRVAQGINVTSY